MAVIPLVKEGAKTIPHLADLSTFALATRPLALDEKGAALLNEETVARLERLASALRMETDWAPSALAPVLRAFAEAEGVGMGKFGPALRAVLSGGAPAPDLASALSALGAQRVWDASKMLFRNCGKASIRLPPRQTRVRPS